MATKEEEGLASFLENLRANTAASLGYGPAVLSHGPGSARGNGGLSTKVALPF